MIAKIIGVVCLMTMAWSTAFAQAPGPRVELSLIVTDKDKKAVSSISKETVRVVEDKVEQTVLSVEADERPIDYGLVIDASGSMRALFDNVVEAGKLIVINGRPSDQFFIERFVSSDKIARIQDFTSEAQSLNRALDSLFVEGGLSAVLDGVYTGAAYLAKHNKNITGRRKVLILISDGEDRNSRTKLDELLKQLRKEDIQVFVVGLISKLDEEAGSTQRSPREKAKQLLTTIAEESGGRAFFPGKENDLARSAAQIITDVRSQFRITYQSSNEIVKSGLRKVEVNLISPSGEKRNAIAPRSYYVDSKDVQAKPTEKKSP